MALNTFDLHCQFNGSGDKLALTWLFELGQCLGGNWDSFVVALSTCIQLRPGANS